MPLSARAAVALVTLSAGSALACPGPDWRAKPYLGEITFTQRLEMDSLSITGIAGGVFNLRDCGIEGEGLTGYDGDGLIDVRPDLVLHLLGEAPQLVVGAENEDDILLLVRDPEGRWHFDDGRGRDPLVVIDAPPAGDYAIWTGTHGSTRFTGPGRLMVSETGS